jgi:nucleoside-diphosphate-sugar epimerase
MVDMGRNGKVLVTGGAGRLGTIICRALLDEGFSVRIFDLDTARNRKAVKPFKNSAEIIWGDITRRETLLPALENIDAVLHMAAILPPVSYLNPELTRRVNVGGTLNIVDAIKQTGKPIPFIYTSSAAAFGPTPEATGLICPDTTICNPKDPYGKSKYEAENYIRDSGIDYAILRLSATMYFVFGTSDFKRMFSVPLNNRIEHIHPDDTSLALINAIKRFNDIKGKTLIITGGPDGRMLYRDMIKKMLAVVGLPLPPEHKFTRVPYYLDWYNSVKSQELLKYQRKNFEQYLKDCKRELGRAYTPLFVPCMRYFIGPLFGRLIVRMV